VSSLSLMGPGGRVVAYLPSTPAAWAQLPDAALSWMAHPSILLGMLHAGDLCWELKSLCGRVVKSNMHGCMLVAPSHPETAYVILPAICQLVKRTQS